MKIRSDFVTNSSSSSYIICFARIDNWDKANEIIDKYDIKVLDVEGVNSKKNCYGMLGADWCGAEIYSANKVMQEHPDDSYVVIQDWLEAEYNDFGDIVYSYDFDSNKIIEAITKENGFADIEVAEGEGRNG